jgi:hypothetical protein
LTPTREKGEMKSGTEQIAVLSGFGILLGYPQYTPKMGARVQLDFGNQVIFNVFIGKRELLHLSQQDDFVPGNIWHVSGECWLNAVNSFPKNNKAFNPVLWCNSIHSFRGMFMSERKMGTFCVISAMGVVSAVSNSGESFTVEVENYRKNNEIHNIFSFRIEGATGDAPPFGTLVTVGGRLSFVATDEGIEAVIHAQAIGSIVDDPIKSQLTKVPTDTSPAIPPMVQDPLPVDVAPPPTTPPPVKKKIIPRIRIT